MKFRLSIILLLSISCTLRAQYYYKDIITSRQTSDLIAKYREQKVSSVKMISYEANGERVEDFSGSQIVADNFTTTKTTFQTLSSGLSELATYFNAKGQVIKSVDTTDGSRSVSDYSYNDKGQLTRILNTSTSAGAHLQKEEHLWYYDQQGQPEKLLRIKNETDTLYVTFVLDESGNVAEENSVRRKVVQPSYYYYYDDSKRLTDIATYNQKAGRLLPVYVFDYNQLGQLNSMMVVPEGTDDYQKWLYEYNTSGLKAKETAYNKRKQVLGRVDYEYKQ